MYENYSKKELIDRIRELEINNNDKYFNKQASPKLPANTFLADKTLEKYLRIILPSEEFQKHYENLKNYGEKCGSVYPEKAKEAELFKPIFEKYDVLGK